MKRNRTSRLGLCTALVVVMALAGCSLGPRSHGGTGGLAAPQAINDSARSQMFDEGWKFSREDPAGARDAAFDDAKWREVQLPHDWSIEEPFNDQLASCTGYLPGGIGWYRKVFTLPTELKSRRVGIRFDGVYENSEVWCNGHSLGKRPYGYISFEYDLTPYLMPGGGTNVIAVRVDHSQYADSRWYSGSGIYRNVFLTMTDDVHVAGNGTYIRTPEVSEQAASVAIATTVKNDGSHGSDVTVVSTILDPDGKELSGTEAPGSVAAGGEWVCTQSVVVNNPALWSPEHPALYTLRTRVLEAGSAVDEYVTPFGIRSFKFDADKGFSLNGRTIKLKGVCIHHEAGALGAAVPLQVWERRLARLKEGGCNAIRTSHNPPAPEVLDLCDRMGFLVMDEAFDEWTRGKKKWLVGVNKGKPSLDGYSEHFLEWSDTDLHDMIVRDRNHPSIIMWSIGNEIDYRNDPYPPNSPELPPIAARLIRVVKGLDLTRPVTAACAAIPSNLFAPQLDVVGYNYQEKLYAADHAKYPSRVIYGSENKHGADAWQAVVDNDFIAGQFLWTGIDYLGEARGWPNRGETSGLLDAAGFEKPLYYFRKSLWTAEPMVHLAITRAGTSAMGAPLPATRSATVPARGGLSCFTNCDSVELFRDGKSVGEKPLPSTRFITWPLELADGNLKAVGKKGGIAVCEFEMKKAGEPARLTIAPDRSVLAADGRDVAQIEVQVTDRDGTRIPDGSNVVTCTLSGPGKILGIENGDQNSHEDFHASSHHLHQGRLLIYVQSLKRPGEIALKLSGDQLESATTRIVVK